MLQTTYQHDYVHPNTYQYQFGGKAKIGEDDGSKKEAEVCQCDVKPEIELPKSLEDQECNKAEWTGIAPMSRLIEPRIIPTKFSPQQAENIENSDDNECFKMPPNRFLKILRNAYPDLYERLKDMPQNELNRRMDKQRLLTTYQIDYCHINEYPSGIYESLKKEEETSKINASKLLQRQEPCSEFRTHIMQELSKEQGTEGSDTGTDPCEKAYKRFKISFPDSSRFVNSGDNSHWRADGGNIFTKRANITEYMDTISRNGCVIVKNNIHDHSKCKRGNCRHQLANTCPHMK